MFNLFKKNSFIRETKAFANSFTTEQKASIVASQIIIANTFDSMVYEEEKYLENIANILHIDLNDRAFIDIHKRGEIYLIVVLKSLSKAQKEWYAISANGLTECTGMTRITKQIKALEILGKIGISDKEFYELIKKSRSIYNRYF